MPIVPLFSPFGPTLETQRLWLRPPVSEDFEGFCAFFADEITMKHLGGTQAPSVVWRTLRSVAGQWSLDGFGLFSVIDKTSGAFVGRVGPQYPWGYPAKEVGWGLLSAYYGRGLAYEAARASMDYAAFVLGWSEVIHAIAPENTASEALAQRLGSKNLGPGQLPEPHAHVKINLWGQSLKPEGDPSYKIVTYAP